MTRPPPSIGLSIASTDGSAGDFPALERMHAGRPVAYFDGPGGTQVPTDVLDAMVDYLIHHNANTHWAFPTSEETDSALAAARGSPRRLPQRGARGDRLRRQHDDLTFHLAPGAGASLGPGDAIVVTELDHHANIDPWRPLERERGVDVLQVKMVPETGQLDWDDLDRCLTDHRTRLLAIGAASNALGTINDVARAVAMAREADALTFVDAVHYAPHQLVDVREWGCDFLACSAYKFYGPHVGVLYGRRDRIEDLEVAKLEPAPETAPERLETGTQNHEGIVGAAAAVDYLASLAGDGSGGDDAPRRERLRAAFDALHDRGCSLVARLWDGLSAHRRRQALRPSSGCSPDADALVHRRRPSLFRGQPPARRAGDLRLARRLLCGDGRPPAGRRRTGPRPHRMRLLLDRGRDRPGRRRHLRDRERTMNQQHNGALAVNPADKPAWLKDVQGPPEHIPASATRPMPLLFDAEHRPIATLAAWNQRRGELRRAWEDFLGLIPGPRPARRWEVVREERPEGAIRQLIRYETERGLAVEGYLLRPDRPGEVDRAWSCSIPRRNGPSANRPAWKVRPISTSVSSSRAGAGSRCVPAASSGNTGAGPGSRRPWTGSRAPSRRDRHGQDALRRLAGRGPARRHRGR